MQGPHNFSDFVVLRQPLRIHEFALHVFLVRRIATKFFMCESYEKAFVRDLGVYSLTRTVDAVSNRKGVRE